MMLWSRRVLALAVAMLLVAALPARAADTVTADDTAKFLAGMMPSADSPLMPLTRDPAWQRHAKFFDAAFAQLDFDLGTTFERTVTESDPPSPGVALPMLAVQVPAGATAAAALEGCAVAGAGG